MLGNENLEWNRENVISLRRRLGWSKSDLARRLNCQPTDVEGWEDGEQAISSSIQGLLQVLSRQADACHDEVKYTPAAENELDKQSLNQIDFSRFKDDFE